MFKQNSRKRNKNKKKRMWKKEENEREMEENSWKVLPFNSSKMLTSTPCHHHLHVILTQSKLKKDKNKISGWRNSREIKSYMERVDGPF